MSDNKVNGSCFCKKVNYEISGNMGVFQYCHCSRCRKVTGSAHAANLFVAPDDFKWLSGEENVRFITPLVIKKRPGRYCSRRVTGWGSRDQANAKYSLRLTVSLVHRCKFLTGT